MDEQILTSSQRHMLAWHLATLKAQVRFLSELLNIPNLEAQQETPASASQPTEQPAPSSSEATEMAEETKPISSISWRQSYLVNQGGFHYSDPAQDILDWLSSHRLAGMGPEVEIGVTLTSKASTPPAGSASPSTAEPTPEASGVVGSREFVDSHVHEWHIVVGYPRRFRCFKFGIIRYPPPPSRPHMVLDLRREYGNVAEGDTEDDERRGTGPSLGGAEPTNGEGPTAESGEPSHSANGSAPDGAETATKRD